MERKKCTVNLKLMNAMVEKIKEEDLPISVTTGRITEDYNGDKQIEVLFEYQTEDKMIFSKALDDVFNNFIQ